jgi:hypothetical protein
MRPSKGSKQHVLVGPGTAAVYQSILSFRKMAGAGISLLINKKLFVATLVIERSHKMEGLRPLLRSCKTCLRLVVFTASH